MAQGGAMSDVISRSSSAVAAEAWGTVPLSALAERIMVGIASAATHAYRAKGIPMFRNQNIKAGYLDDGDLLFIAPEYESAFKNKRLRAGDLLTMRTGYPGVTAIVPGWYEHAQSFTTLITRPKKDCIHSLFLCYYINSEFGKKFFEQSQIGGAQKNVNAGTLRGMPVPLPPRIEQKAIAATLSDVDALIAGLERLIAKKRDIKQAAMQQLLTGQTRLPGFRGQWEPRRLGHLGAFLKGSGVKRDQALSGELPCIRYGEIYTVHSDVVRSFHSRISPQVAATATRIQRGDLLFAGSGETKAEIGKCVAIASSVEAYAGGDVVILRLRAGDPSFFGYLLNTPAVARQKANLGQGDAVVHISASALSGIEVQVPTVDEQTAIAIVLSDMDADLSVLESRLAKTRAIKQGMMQELLTGRTRLVDSVEEAPVQKTEPAEARKANVHFMRSVLAAEIVDQLHNEPTFGHVKFEKMMFLAEHLCQVDTGSHYARKAAGPLDRQALHSIDSQLRKQAWFDVRKENGRYRYVPLEKRGGHQPYFNRYFATIRTQLSEILDTFRSWETERCEIVATLYAAWNDLLKEKGSVSDDMIVHEVLNNWHESKQRIPEERWLKALGWMREKGYVPGPVAESIAR
jgi:type I restriction enzyme, S subunit